MRNMDMLLTRICDELDKIAETGLKTGNLDTAYKLVDMYKDLKNTKYWETKAEYYMAELDEMASPADGYSERRHRDSLGRYSRSDGQNMERDYDRSSSYRFDGRARNTDYSRDSGSTYNRYMDSKQSYRATKSQDCKQRLMDSLESHMENFAHQMEEMLRDSDCAEERATIRKYLDKLHNLT